MSEGESDVVLNSDTNNIQILLFYARRDAGSLKKATCVALSDQFLIFGTEAGELLALREKTGTKIGRLHFPNTIFGLVLLFLIL